LTKFGSLKVTAYSYTVAACLMAVLAVSGTLSCDVLEVVCAESDDKDDGRWTCSRGATTKLQSHGNTDADTEIACSAWGVPPHAAAALVYMVLVQSGLCYFLVTWGTERTHASNTLLYTSLNPAAAAMLTAVLVWCGKDFGVLTLPTWNMLGVIGIIVGIGIVFSR